MEWSGRVPFQQHRSDALRVLSGETARKNAPDFKSYAGGPFAQPGSRGIAGGIGFKRDQHIAPEAFHPGILPFGGGQFPPKQHYAGKNSSSSMRQRVW